MGMATILKAGTVGAGAAYGVIKLAEPWYAHWGSTKAEQTRAFPGEEGWPHGRVTSTHAVTIDAPPAAVWQWLVQIGQDRGGFYSYSWLENLVGCHLKNTDRIQPELQGLKAGDAVRLHPKAPPLTVSFLAPERALALEGWAFFLEPLAGGQTRFFARTYEMGQDGSIGPVASVLFRTAAWSLAHFIMQRKMMLTIKALAEGRRGAVTREQSQALAGGVG